MASRRLLFVLLAWLFLAAAPARAAEKGVVSDLTWNLSEADAQQEAAVIAGIGAQWATVDISWRNAEPSDGTYYQWEFDNLARAIDLARGAGARVLLTVSETPAWASGQADPRFPPIDPAKLAEFYAEIVSRFGATVDAWQVWNEPNHPHFWQPDPTTDANACAPYAAMLQAVAPVIRAGDPTGRVLFAGLSYNDYAYVERCLQLDPALPAAFDVMVTHPYAMGGAAPEAERDVAPQDGRLDKESFLAYREVRKVVDKPIWFSEMGWSTCTDNHPLGCVTHEQQADYLTRAYKLLEQDDYVQVAIWYSLRNIGPDGPSWLDQLGLYTSAFEPKPAAKAFADYQPPAPPAGQEPVPDSPAPTPTDPRAPGADSPDGVAATVSLRVRRLGGRRVKATGRVTGVTSGKVRLVVQRRLAGGGHRTIKRITTAVERGRFSRKFRVGRSGRWRVRARFMSSTGAAPVRSRFVAFRTRR